MRPVLATATTGSRWLGTSTAFPADRFDDYIAALTAGGPLVPMAPVAAPTNGHQ